MPYELRLSKRLRTCRWKVKIWDKEGTEDPHLTIVRWPTTWRVSLRTSQFIEKGQSWKQIDDDVRAAIEASWETLRSEWDTMYPKNPI